MTEIQNPKLKSAIESLYRVFSRYKLLSHVHGCTHCVGDKDHALIHSKPLRELGTMELRKYAFKAMSTWGSESDFKHFLPRIFELISNDGGCDWIDPEIAFGKLTYGEWSNWTTEEQLAIRQFLFELWIDQVGRYPSEFRIDDLLCSIAQAESDLQPYLEAWSKNQSPSSAIQMAELITENYPPNGKPIIRINLHNSWWKNRPVQERQVLDWLASNDRNKAIEDVFFNSSDEETRKILADGLTHLQIMQSVFPDNNA